MDWPDSVNDRVGNILLSRIMGAEVRLGGRLRHRVQASWKQAIDEVEQGGVPYPIPAGASDHRLGGLGFANWARRGAAPGGASSACSSTPSWSARSPAPPTPA